MKKISVSFLSCNDKEEGLYLLNHTDTDYIHVDEMDGIFVENKNHPYHDVKKFCSYSSKKLDVHLMEENPYHSIEKYASLNTEFVTIPIEIEEDISKLIDIIHSYGIKAGLAINPNTNLSLLDSYLDDIDLILVMSVFPGKGGQPFLEESIERIKIVRKKIKYAKREILLEVDGGVKKEQRPLLEDVDIIVSGSYITNSNNYQERITSLR